MRIRGEIGHVTMHYAVTKFDLDADPKILTSLGKFNLLGKTPLIG